ncbi:NAD(P)H-hydrate dehydratase [Aquirufa novilacunae]|uniref:ADP-dependent (S)-NAD(P)H-hydrate dehydratase n=1 Tax=Aquirufa novilacunae TaxID=3139305 RepID=A0ABW8TXG6_9BACT
MNQIDANWVAAHTKHRLIKGHKKTFGHVLVIAGSPGKVGSGILSARAALHAGCGLVTAMIPSEGVSALLAGSPEIMYTSASLRELDLSSFDAIAIGPGIGFSDEAVANVRYLLETYVGPLVIDADALSILGLNPDLLNLLNERHILTPHIGEFARIQKFSGNSEQQSFAFAHTHNTNLILKSSPTLVSLPSGQQFVNTTGNDGMATAGSGDVLTGITAALCAQGYVNADAACLAVYVHGLAADIAIETQSKSSLVASDIIENLGKTRLLD